MNILAGVVAVLIAAGLLAFIAGVLEVEKTMREIDEERGNGE